MPGGRAAEGRHWRHRRPREALLRAGIDDLLLHDTRHEVVSRLAQKVDVLSLARILGHLDPRSLMIDYNPEERSWQVR